MTTQSAGVLVGWALSWVALLLGAQARCDPSPCVGPDLTPWIRRDRGRPVEIGWFVLAAVAAFAVLVPR